MLAGPHSHQSATRKLLTNPQYRPSSADLHQTSKLRTVSMTATGAMIETIGYASTSPEAPLGPFSFARREPGPTDVRIDILFCGVCHSDLHTARGEWPGTVYPCVPGHEIIGRVAETGTSVKGFKRGDLVGVGCMVDSCQHCASCAEGLEQYCENGMTGTYKSPGKPHPSPGVFNLIMKRRSLAGSLIGGIAETQELLDFCAKHNIVSEIETIPIDRINEAYDRMLKSDVRYRFVIDMKSLPKTV